jgi:hypothetical protein
MMEPAHRRIRYPPLETANVASFDAERPEYVAVVCPVCRTRIDARVREQPGTVECPDCFTQVDVPALEAVVSSRPVTQELPDPGTYSIAAEPDHPRRSAPPEPAVAALACPSCGTSVDAELGDRPRNITCPECLEVIPVPALHDARPKPKRRRKRRQSPEFAGEEDGLPPEGFHGAAPAPDLLKAEGEIRREPPPPIPTWTFFTSVFSLPWHQEVLSRWIYMSIGCCLIGLTCAAIHWLVAEGFIIAIPFFALPVVWLVLLTGSFAVSSSTTVIEDTASGNDVIHNWNDGGWKDRMWDTFGPAFLAVVTWTASYFVGKITAVAAGEGWFWPVSGTVLFVLFPIVLLSALQAGSYRVPLTLPVLKSLIRKTWAWGLFYGLTGLIAAAYVATVRYGLSRGFWFTTLILTGPLVSTAMLISARLLGRLGWKTLLADAGPGEDGGGLSSRGKKRRRAKKRSSPPSL